MYSQYCARSSFVKNLSLSLHIIFQLVSLIHGQLNLYRTDRTQISSLPSDAFDCLYYYVLENIVMYNLSSIDFNPTHQIIPYCVRTNRKASTSVNPLANSTAFTFGDLQTYGIEAYDLLSWSAPFDLVERYQEYVNDLTPNKTSHDVFYNCSWPWFGALCEYTFYLNMHSFESIVRMMFLAKDYRTSDNFKPTMVTNLTCYTHLNCTRGALPACLDWREICDGRINCLNDGVDEQNCFQLEANQCSDDEFQCRNGMCIPASFFDENSFDLDCMDGSDESRYQRLKMLAEPRVYCFQDPAFRCEEVSYAASFLHMFCGDGQACSINSQICCKNGRDFLLKEIIESYEENKHLSNECWHALYCSTNHAVRLTAECSIYCIKKTNQCIINMTKVCSSSFAVYPQKPVFDGHIRYVYLTNQTHILQDILHIDGLSCVTSEAMSLDLFEYSSLDFFQACFIINMSGNDTHCRDSSLFHCPNTSKCISKQRLVDMKVDCFDGADEKFNASCALAKEAHRFRCSSEEKCIPWLNFRNNIHDCFDGEDELSSTNEPSSFSFQIICSGFQHIDLISFDEMNETDETNCEEWPCSNIYTRCDGGWTCLNGEDEIGCDTVWQQVVECPPNHHPCVSPSNLTKICLPITQFNDSVVNCLGALDELAYCRQQMGQTDHKLATYRCWN
ncbi:unnamed protein product, partial [Adineta ricciae]